jgi:hypothetical protein
MTKVFYFYAFFVVPLVQYAQKIAKSEHKERVVTAQ